MSAPSYSGFGFKEPSTATLISSLLRQNSVLRRNFSAKCELEDKHVVAEDHAALSWRTHLLNKVGLKLGHVGVERFLIPPPLFHEILELFCGDVCPQCTVPE